MSHENETGYAVRAILEDGSYVPREDLPEELDWFSLPVAKKIAAKAYEARQRVVGSPVKVIEIIDADYQTVQSATFKD